MALELPMMPAINLERRQEDVADDAHERELADDCCPSGFVSFSFAFMSPRYRVALP